MLILIRHSAATIAPISAAVARGRTCRKIAAAVMPSRSTLTRAYVPIGSLDSADRRLNVSICAPTPSHTLSESLQAMMPLAKLATSQPTAVKRRPASLSGARPNNRNSAP